MPILTLDGDASGAVRATAAVAAEAQKLVPVFREVSDATGKAGESHNQAFGAHSLNELVSYAAGMMSVHKAVEFVTDALREQAEEKRKAAANVTGGLLGAGTIANIGGGQQEVDRNIAFGRKLMQEGIVPRDQQSLAFEQAAGIAASGASDKDRDFIVEIGKQKRIAPGQLGQFSQDITRYREAMGPGVGSFQDVAKQFIRAGSDTLGVVGPEEIGRQAADTAATARENGVDPTKDLAAFTTFARTTKSARRAGQLTKDYLAGKTDLSPEQSARFAIETQSLQGAPKEALPDYLATDPRLGAARGAEESEAGYQSEFEANTAEATSLYQRLHTYNRRNIRGNLGYGFTGGVASAVDRVIGGTGSILGQEESALHTAAEQGAGKYPAEFISELNEHFERNNKLLERQTELMERKDQTTPSPSGRQE